MAIEFKLPDIGEGLADGEIVKWLVSEGDQVEEDQPLVEVLTDKATVEIPSPHGGRILELRAQEGDVVAIGATILLFAEADDESAEETTAKPQPESSEETSEATDQIELAREVARSERSAVEAELIEAEPEPAGEDSDIIEAEPEPAGEGSEPMEGDSEPPAGGSQLEDDEPPLVDDGSRPAVAASFGGRALATPATRKLAHELGVDITRVPGSGVDGRVMKEDVRAFLEGKLPEVSAPQPQEEPEEIAPETVEAPAAPAPPPPVDVTLSVPGTPEEIPPPVADMPEEIPPPAIEVPEEIAPPVADLPEVVEPPVAGPPTTLDDEERVPLRGLRRTIAERMVVAKQTAPHYTYVEEADMEEVVHLRAEAKAMAAEHGVKLTYLPFIVRALTMALRNHPYVNASLDDEAGEIVLKRYYNIGIATATERGLIVPVIKNAEALGLFELASEIQRLSSAARDGSIALEDLQGGTFTITSTGNIGGLIATPILNLPEVAILGVTAIRKRPVVRDDQVVIRHMVNFSLTLDHRVVDGAVGALFMRDLVKLLEDPKLQLIANS